jgi:hypothetical protein
MILFIEVVSFVEAQNAGDLNPSACQENGRWGYGTRDRVRVKEIW